MTQNSNISTSSRSVRLGFYFDRLNDEVNRTYKVGQKARQVGLDPRPYVEIPLATTMAERVEGLVGPIGVAEEIEKLADKGHTSILIAVNIAEQIVHEKFGSNYLPEQIADQAIRTGTAIITNGVVSAPLEGVASVTISSNNQRKHLTISYASPIRGAGGTAQAMSVVLAEIVRKGLHLKKFRPTHEQIERYVEEINLYSRVKHLQFPVFDEGIRIAVRNLSIEIDGEPTEKQEVTAYRDLPEVSTNRIRGGMCLVLSDGIVGRWNKSLKTVEELGLAGWEWLRAIPRAKKRSNYETVIEEDHETLEDQESKFVEPEFKYVSEVIGGRPIFAHPSQKGGFRLRYGRARNTGLAAVGINPATMTIIQFLAPGTHIVTERPGKGSIVAPVSTIEGPLLLLEDRSVVRINRVEDAARLLRKGTMQEILELGDILVSFGEFVENNHDLVPSGYVEEWWAQDVSSALDLKLSSLSGSKMKELPLLNRIRQLIMFPLQQHPTIDEAIAISQTLNVPLHPRFTPNWHDLSIDEFWTLRKLIRRQLDLNDKAKEGILDFDPEIKELLEKLSIPHRVNKDILYLEDYWQPIFYGLLLDQKHVKRQKIRWGEPDQIGKIRFRWKAPVMVGTRLGRPEKAKERKMKPPVHVLFPVGNHGGPSRNLVKVRRQGRRSIEVEIQHRYCPKCSLISANRICPVCRSETEEYYICTRCGEQSEDEICSTCSAKAVLYSTQEINFVQAFSNAEKRVGKAHKLVKGVKLLMSKARTPEPIEKGILRARYNVFTFKDGTCRFDMTDAPITHFRPQEIDTNIQKLHELGYSSDIEGKRLRTDDQLVEILPQDIIVNKRALEYLFRVSKFVDEELKLLYDQAPFYSIQSPRDLVGHLVVGLAPHTSAGIIGRIIGSTPAEVCYSHPFWHAAKRRNCLAPSEEILIWNPQRNELLREPIGEIVEETIRLGATQEIVDDFGTCAIENLWPHLRAISIDSKTREPILQPIRHWIKGQSNEWVEIRTKKGRTMKMTADHLVLVWNPYEDAIVKTKAAYLKPGMYLPIVADLNLPTVELPARINILKELSENLPDVPKFQTFKHQVRLRNAADWMRRTLNEFFSRLNPGAKKVTLRMVREFLLAHLGEKLPSRPYEQPFSLHWYESIPLNHLEVLHREGVFTWDNIPKDAVLGMARDDHTTEPYIPFNADFMRLLGYYISEGYIRDEGACCQTNFSLPNPDLRDHVDSLIQDLLGSPPYFKTDNQQLVHTGRIHAYLFAYAWRMGTQALTKRIPSFIFIVPPTYRYHFLSALIDGDGTIIPQACRTTIYTGNERLTHDYCLLLSTLGVFARVHRGKGDRYGRKSLERYEELGIEPKKGTSLFYVNIPGKENKPLVINLCLEYKKKKKALQELGTAIPQSQKDFMMIGDKILADKIKDMKVLREKGVSYCLEVTNDETEEPVHHNVVLSSSLATSQCDGDEDAIFLVMDALLNFSKHFLPITRGGLMDAPLVLSAHLEPSEVDSEAHNVDTGWLLPLAFYQATWRSPSYPPKEINLVHQAKHRLGTPLQYEGFGFTHDTIDIAAGPKRTLYKQLETMVDKVREQMNIAQRIRAVDANDVARRVLDSHFFRDMTGNLRAFGTQTVRCIKCNRKYRRMPLNGRCACNGKLILTVFPESTRKYLAIAKNLESKFVIPEFARSRIKLFELIHEQLFSGEQKQQQLDSFFGTGKHSQHMGTEDKA